jgi:hypothetical protein
MRVANDSSMCVCVCVCVSGRSFFPEYRRARFVVLECIVQNCLSVSGGKRCAAPAQEALTFLLENHAQSFLAHGLSGLSDPFSAIQNDASLSTVLYDLVLYLNQLARSYMQHSILVRASNITYAVILVQKALVILRYLYGTTSPKLMVTIAMPRISVATFIRTRSFAPNSIIVTCNRKKKKKTDRSDWL